METVESVFKVLFIPSLILPIHLTVCLLMTATYPKHRASQLLDAISAIVDSLFSRLILQATFYVREFMCLRVVWTRDSYMNLRQANLMTEKYRRSVFRSSQF